MGQTRRNLGPKGDYSMQSWEAVLESLHRQGWGYGYAKCLDAESGAEVYLVNISRGAEKLTTVRATLEEAVSALSRLAAARARPGNC
jgi:phosphoribosyl-dephospho-CoA transferase